MEFEIEWAKFRRSLKKKANSLHFIMKEKFLEQSHSSEAERIRDSPFALYLISFLCKYHDNELIHCCLYACWIAFLFHRSAACFHNWFDTFCFKKLFLIHCLSYMLNIHLIVFFLRNRLFRKQQQLKKLCSSEAKWKKMSTQGATRSEQSPSN